MLYFRIQWVVQTRSNLSQMLALDDLTMARWRCSLDGVRRLLIRICKIIAKAIAIGMSAFEY
jgi:hypothetical protein